MTARTHFIEGLVELPTWTDANVRQAVFRQSIAELGRSALSGGPSPLDGVHPERLLEAMTVARGDGLLNDLSFLAPDAAYVALYELASALPMGPERRELGRRVLAQLFEGTAHTFVAIAARMAATASRALVSSGAKARIALALELPRWTNVRADTLALALASRRDLSRTWIGAPSTGSLPERRLAARLLERASRELSRRAREGDPSGLRLLRHVSRAAAQRRHFDLFADPIAGAWHRLLPDRESLVWRHVAIARGLLSSVVPEIGEEVSDMLDPSLSPTEWRRGATSLVAAIAFEPERSVRRVVELLRGPLLQRDPGIATAMMWAIGAAAESEPEAAEEALDALVETWPISVAEGLVELRADLLPPGGEGAFGARAAESCAAALGEGLQTDDTDEGLSALGRAILADLTGQSPDGIRPVVARALQAFSEEGARRAHALSLEAVTLANETVDALVAIDPSPLAGAHRLEQRASVRLLREIDTNLFEANALKFLLLLDRRPSDEDVSIPALEALHDRLGAWLLAAEARGAPDNRDQTQHARQLRALLHVIDAEANDLAADYDRVGRVRAGWMTTSSVLLTRLAAERRSPLRRAIAATIARAFDALARDGAADPADILLYASARVEDADDLDVLGEASVEPDVAELLRVYSRFARTTAAHLAAERALSEKPHETEDPPPDLLAPLDALTSELPVGASPRIEVLRTTLEQILRGLEAVRAAGSLSQLGSMSASAGESGPLAMVDTALERLGQLVAGARRRCGDETVRDVPSVRIPSLHTTMLGMLGPPSARGGAPESTDTPRSIHLKLVGPTLFAWVGSLSGALPQAIADVVMAVITRLLTLPAEEPKPQAVTLNQAPLPLWVPPRRIVGGFYVHHQIGGGALGTVFVVTRAEERHNPKAERFALKVPEYDATAARTVSEGEFMRMFRLEAGALLSVPDHKNVARFVTFDAGARPKPILVMELIEGTRCDHVLASRGLDTLRALSLLDGVLAGLETMHSVGVGHLDVKPSNVILRPNGDPVLVDFGLAGRHIRPGCGTGCYCAPEVWGVLPKGGDPTPMTADIYAFGCFAFEVLTTRTLFGGITDAALISAHLTHDGSPPPVKRLSEIKKISPFASFLTLCLRQNPNHRLTATELRKRLAACAREIGSLEWPLGG